MQDIALADNIPCSIDKLYVFEHQLKIFKHVPTCICWMLIFKILFSLMVFVFLYSCCILYF